MTRVSGNTKTSIIEFFESHRTDLKYAKKGYIPRLLQQLKEENDITISAGQLKRILDYFRITHNCPLEYVENSHYRPVGNPTRNYRLPQPACAEHGSIGTCTGGTV